MTLHASACKNNAKTTISNAKTFIHLLSNVVMMQLQHCCHANILKDLRQFIEPDTCMIMNLLSSINCSSKHTAK